MTRTQLHPYTSRCFDVLGFDEYLEGHADGLQILRYNLTTAYIPHMDWFATTDATNNDDYDSAKKGGNRFATILLYMSDLEPDDGGETVFTEAWPSYLPENERTSIKTVEYIVVFNDRTLFDANFIVFHSFGRHLKNSGLPDRVFCSRVRGKNEWLLNVAHG